MSGTRCLRLQEDLVGLLEGSASEGLTAHVASCDTCRDGQFELERLAEGLAHAGDDVAFDDVLSHRLVSAAADAALASPRIVPSAEAVAASGEDTRTSETRLRASEKAPVAPVPMPSPLTFGGRGKRGTWLLLGALASVAVSAAVGFSLASKKAAPVDVASRAWHGKVAKIARAGADKTGGLSVNGKSGESALAEGAEIKAGMELVTDGRTRARLELDDGSVVVLDRATKLVIGDKPRTVSLEDGAILADVEHVEAAPAARIETPSGAVRVLGTKISVTSATDRTNVEVLRGEVEVETPSGKREKISAGQEGVAFKDGRVDVAPANDLAQRAAFGSELVSTHNEDGEAPASGLGELRAKRPGKTDEKDHAVHLAKHAVKVRIAGNVARTEIDEEFRNDTDDELEGIYRFPLPPGAQIERLALEVDGKLVDGEFIDKAKASAIWRGAIQNAAPKAPKPKEEIVWVPGPWHDPALLEWQRGGRFELRIFPIPKRGSRRVVIAYTETVAPVVSGSRRYVYPLPQGASSKLTIDDFQVDAQVLGHDPKTPVRVRGYELEHALEGNAERMKTKVSSFTPSGDLAIEYALEDRKSDLSTWAYVPGETTSAPVAKAAPPNGKDGAVGKDPVGDDAFVALAIRPKLPKWADVKPRDQVIVVDAGRAMFGERFARAKRLAQQMAQEMDRRDRITVLACDISCKAMPGGFAAPGAPAAYDVDAFLAGVTPDGASDLVNAVRSAAHLSGRDKARDLRVVVVSDGVATAGYRSADRVATGVADALDDPRAQVVTVPLGADADTKLLGEIARGGGGVVVPYQPGQRLESTALEVLAASYGTTLRDVALTLPDDLHDIAPAVLPPIRAGAEAIVTARVRRGALPKGDVVLKGKVGGEPFEAHYPIEVKLSSDEGNAFVPRLYAASRIADRERAPGDGARAELVALSRRYAVPSRYTSLLVLESEAMFKAFGIERAAHAPSWTGEVAAAGTVVATKEPAPNDSADDEIFAEKAKKDAPGDGLLGNAFGSGFGGGGRAAESSVSPAPAPAKPAATMGPRAFADEEAPRTAPAARRAAPPPSWRPPPRGGQFMKKIWVRKATISTDAAPAVASDKVAKARAAVQAAPDERGKHRDLARVLALSGQLEELGEVLEKWSQRDPLDQDVILARADLAARRGDRETSLRILGGALAASALSGKEAVVLATAIARSYERAGRPEACAFHVAAAEIDPSDADATARAVACERSAGRDKSAERWLAGIDGARRKAVDSALAKVGKPETATGDVVVSATWDAGVDLDLALVDPSGRRAGAVSRLKGARVVDAASRDRETVALATSEAGSFVVEVSRVNAGETRPVSGRVTIKAFGETREVPFTLSGARQQVGRVDVRWEPQLVALDGTETVPWNGNTGGLAPFDRSAAASALARVSVAHCASDASGPGHVSVTFAPSGAVSSAVVDGGPYPGTGSGRCVQVAFQNARVPAFAGTAVTVGRSFVVPSGRRFEGDL